MGMPGIRILLGNEPRAYRDALAAAFLTLRPELDVLTIEPVDLDREVARLSPHMVICTRLSRAAEASVPAWIVLYPAGAPLTIACIGGERSTADDLSLDALLAFIDLVGQLAFPSTS